jgi:hypothetical protein
LPLTLIHLVADNQSSRKPTGMKSRSIEVSGVCPTLLVYLISDDDTVLTLFVFKSCLPIHSRFIANSSAYVVLWWIVYALF